VTGPNSGHTGPHAGAHAAPDTDPHTGPTTTEGWPKGVKAGQGQSQGSSRSPRHTSRGDEGERPTTGIESQTLSAAAERRWSTRDRNTNAVSVTSVPRQLAPEPVRSSADDGVGDLESVPFWAKTVRLTERWTISEKVNGTHVIVVIEPASAGPLNRPGVSFTKGPAGEQVTVRAASRTRWLVTESEAASGVGRDNFGFAAWVELHATELAALGPGAHHGEWYGAGIGHGYGLTERCLGLFDTARWQRGLPEGVPDGLGLVPVLADCEGSKLNATIARCLRGLARNGSRLVAGAAAEGVIARSAADPRLALKAYIEDSGKEAVQNRRRLHVA
jgi:hypothetical protein